MKNLLSLFNERGYVILDLEYSHDAIDNILTDLNGRYRYDSEHYNLNNRIESAYNISPGVKALACDSNILKTLQYLLGGNFFPFQTLNFERGTEQRFHSDWYHFAPLSNNGLAGVWVAFEDIDEQNGALSVVPGSHKLPYFFPEDFGIKRGLKSDPYKYYNLYEDAIDKVIQNSGLMPVTVPMKKGQILIWHTNLIHGGSRIVDVNRTRYSQVTHYFREGSLYFSPITSERLFFNRSYRFPLNIANGRRMFGY
jgi:hypothetical protein